MKFSDDEYDENSNKLMASILAIFSGILMGYLASNTIDASYIFLTIIIAGILSLKIDGIHHVISLIFFILTCVIFNFFTGPLLGLSLATLIICILAEYIDEIGNDNSKFYKNKFLKFFFDYRLTLEFTVLILALLGVYSSLTGFNIPYVHFIDFSVFIYFLTFDLGYIIAGVIFQKFRKNSVVS
ncbi:hypothetical protein [Methanobrevibacter filiformis]|nr:hypothetical protein [Methanobrevibacter filiformis]